MNYIFYYLATIVPLGLLDAFWILYLAKNFYAAELGFLFTKSVNIIPVVLFYPIYAFVVFVLVVLPAVSSSSWLFALYGGALLGLGAYGAYDLTNHATIPNWPTIITIVDIAWGVVVTSLSSVIAYFIITYFK